MRFFKDINDNINGDGDSDSDVDDIDKDEKKVSWLESMLWKK